MVSSGMHYGWSSNYLPVLENGTYTFQISLEEGSNLAIAPMVGEIFTAILAGFIVDIVGRKRCLVFTSLPLIASWLIIGFSSSIISMLFGRLLAGISDGMLFSIMPMYLGEIAGAKNRGFLSSLCPVSEVLGILFIYIAGATIPLDVAAFVAICFPVLFTCTFSWMPESPYFLCMSGKEEKARKSLEILSGTKNIGEDFNRISIAVKEQNEKKGKFLDLFRVKSNRKALIICVGKLI